MKINYIAQVITAGRTPTCTTRREAKD